MCPSNRTLGAVRQHEEQQWGLPQAFQMLDRDGDGAINGHDLTAFFGGCLGQSLSPEEAASMIAMGDLDGDGAVSLDEFERLVAVQGDFAALLQNQQKETEMAALRRAFDVMDVDKDGRLGQADLQSAMRMVGEPFCDDDAGAMLRAANHGSPSFSALDFDAFSLLMAKV